MKKNVLILLMVISALLIASWFHWLIGYFVLAVILGASALPPGRSALIGFIAAFLVWAGSALYLSVLNGHLLAEQVGSLLGGISPIPLCLLSGLIGGVGAGLIGWSIAHLVLLWK